MYSWLTVVGSLCLLVTQNVAAQELVKQSKARIYDEPKISPDNAHLIAILPPKQEGANGGGEVHLFDLRNEKASVVTRFPDASVRQIAFSPDGGHILVGGSGFFGAWKLADRYNWFLAKGSQEPAFDEFRIETIVTSKKPNRVAYTYAHLKDSDITAGGPLNELKVVLWDVGTVRMDLSSVRAKNRSVFLWYELALSNSGRILAHWNNQTKEIVVLDLTKHPVQHIMARSFKDEIQRLVVASDEKSLWALSREKITQHDFINKKEVRAIDLKYPAASLDITASGKLMIHVPPDKEKGNSAIHFLDPIRGSDQRVELGRHLWGVTISPDQSLLAGNAVEGGIYLWKVDDLVKKAR